MMGMQIGNDVRQDVNMLIQHDWANRAAADARQSDERAMFRTMDFNSAEAAKQRDWSERMSNTSWQRGIADMKAAGINPMAAFHSGGATTPSAATATASPTHATPANTPMYRAGDNNAALIWGTASQIKVNDALADKIGAEADEVRARTPVHAETIAKIRQDVEHSQEAVRLMVVQGAREGATAANLQQQTQNLRANLPVMEATIKHMNSMVRLNDAQITQLAEQGKLTRAQVSEIIQRVKENLPKANAALLEIKRIIEGSNVPQAQARGNVYGASGGLTGEILEFLRAINPLNGLFKGGSTTTINP